MTIDDFATEERSYLLLMQGGFGVSASKTTLRLLVFIDSQFLILQVSIRSLEYLCKETLHP